MIKGLYSDNFSIEDSEDAIIIKYSNGDMINFTKNKIIELKELLDNFCMVNRNTAEQEFMDTLNRIISC